MRWQLAQADLLLLFPKNFVLHLLVGEIGVPDVIEFVDLFMFLLIPFHPEADSYLLPHCGTTILHVHAICIYLLCFGP